MIVGGKKCCTRPAVWCIQSAHGLIPPSKAEFAPAGPALSTAHDHRKAAGAIAAPRRGNMARQRTGP
jgi:hypothetical protein